MTTKNGKITKRAKKSTASSTTVSNVKRKPLSNITSKTKNSIIDSKSNLKITKTKIEKLTDLNNNNRRLRRIRVGLSNPVPSLKRARTA
ncbi:unnamed protein product [[Candida] boidinii]|nr:unnamed protein product [[Candida] boidinii]